MSASRVERIGGATLYLGDCRELLAEVGHVDAVVTDPPYGVSAGEGSGLRAGGGKVASRKAKSAYLGAFVDNVDYVVGVTVPVIEACIANRWRCALTPGIKHHRLYPAPDHTGTFQYPGSCTMSAWGPALWQPILYYGRDPHAGKLVPDSRQYCNDIDTDTDHPCPKPLKSWQWLVNRASRPGEIVLDPFMGSGTTGVACANLGRRFVGIEIEPRFFATACNRIAAAYRQSDLFIKQPEAVA